MFKLNGFLVFSLIVIAWSSSLCFAKSVSFLERVEKNLTAPSCTIQDDCNTEFFKLDNYCCRDHCCNYFDFVFNQPGQSSFENFLYTLSHPRAVNVLVGIAFALSFVFGLIFLIGICRCCKCRVFCHVTSKCC
jgi:hypothetical protein